MANHDFTGLPLDANGWTDYETLLAGDGYENARVVFVSTDGDDGAGQIYGRNALGFDDDGCFQAVGAPAPYATIAAGMAQMRDGFPDIMLLKRGDSWSDTSFVGDNKPKSGKHLLARSIISSYGASTVRPRVLTGLSGGSDASGVRYIVFDGIHFFADDYLNYDPLALSSIGRSYNAQSNSQHQLIERCIFERFRGGRVEAGTAVYVVFRRNTFRDTIAHDGMLFIGGRAKWILLEQNIFYKPNRTEWDDHRGRTIYLSPGGSSEGKDHHECAWLRDNILYKGSGRGDWSYRTSGPATGNLHIEGDGSWFGGAGGSRDTWQHNQILNNVVADFSREGTATNGIFSIVQQQRAPEGHWPDPLIAGNLFLPILQAGGSTYTILFTTNGDILSFEDLIIENNVFYRASEVSDEATRRAINCGTGAVNSDVHIRNNQIQYGSGGELIKIFGDSINGIAFQGNQYYTTQSDDYFSPGDDYDGWVAATEETESSFSEITYTDPTRRPSNYLGAESSNEALLDACLTQDRHNWDASLTANAINAWLREGFDLSAATLPAAPPDPSIGTTPEAPEGSVVPRVEMHAAVGSGNSSIEIQFVPKPIDNSKLIIVAAITNSPGTVTGPVGFTEIANVGSGSSQARLHIWERDVDGTEEDDASYSISWSGSDRNGILLYREYVGAAGRDSQIATATSGGTRVKSLDVGPTASLDGTDRIALAFIAGGSWVDAAPSDEASFSDGFEIEETRDGAAISVIWTGRKELSTDDGVSTTLSLADTTSHVDGTRLSGAILIFEPAPLTAGGISGERIDDEIVLSSDPAIGGKSPYSYQWHRSTTQGFTPSEATKLDGVTDLEVEDTGLDAETDYYYRMVTTDGNSATVTSNELEALSGSEDPEDPPDPDPPPPGNSTIIIIIMSQGVMS